MGSCESVDEVEEPTQKRVYVGTGKLRKVGKRKFLMPEKMKVEARVHTNTGKITDYITVMDPPIENTYQRLNIEQYLDDDGKFRDPQFVPEKKSLGEGSFPNRIEWKRPDKFMENYEVFERQIQPQDIKQGQLGDCYLLSALSAISEYPFIIKRIFQTTQKSSFGYYAIWLFIDGLWQCTVIDDYFPVYQNQPYFSANHHGEVWVMMVEKAYAKIFGSYAAIETGLTGMAMTAITGAPYEYLCKDSNAVIEAEKAWEFITYHMNQNHILTGSTENNDRNGYLGLVSTHAYAILQAQSVKVDGRNGEKMKEKVVKLRNPWGKFEWKGRWSDHSNVWTESLKKKLSYKNANDGTFWINIDDFISNFGQICACKYNKNYVNTSLLFKFPQEPNGVRGIYLSTKNKTQGFLTLFQRDHRFYKRQFYQYSLVRMMVLQIDRNSHKIQKYIADCFDCDHDATIDLHLHPGDYYIIVEMDWKSDAIREVGLSFYGQHPVNLMQDTTFLSFDQLFNEIVFAHEAYTNRDRVLNYPTDTSIRRISGSFAGYVYYHYSNKSKKNNYLCESVVLKNRTNIGVVGENRPGFFIARVHPEEEKIVKLKVESQANGYYSFSTKIQYYIVERYDLEQLRDITDQKPSKIKKREADQKQINVKVKTYSYSGGLALLYQNKMDKYTYIEDIEFQFENLQLENELLDSDHKMKIVLPSKKEKLLSFVIISPDHEVRFKTKVSFELKSEHEIF